MMYMYPSYPVIPHFVVYHLCRYSLLLTLIMCMYLYVLQALH